MDIIVAGFRKGLMQLQRCQDFAARCELKKALGVTTDTSLWRYSSGDRLLSGDRRAAVEKVFDAYGITDWADDEQYIDN